MSMTEETYCVVYSPAAKEDIHSIYTYIAYELLAEQTAKNQINRIRETIHGLDILPERYEVVDWEPWISMGMRKVPVDNYVVYYMVDKGSRIVTIVRIFYSGRDVQSIIQEI